VKEIERKDGLGSGSQSAGRQMGDHQLLDKNTDSEYRKCLDFVDRLAKGISHIRLSGVYRNISRMCPV
jgi:hypothetical protein